MNPIRNVLLAAFAVSLAACTSVDSTEHCVLTRYGKVSEQKMATGLTWTPLSEPTCFKMTEQNYPLGKDSDGKPLKELISAQTGDPITVEGDVAIVYKFDPATIFTVFEEKRSAEQAELEVVNSIREGYRNALAQWFITPRENATALNIFTNRAALADSIQAHIQRKIGKRAQITKVFVRDIKVPSTIEEARVAAARQASVLDQAQKQLAISEANARATVTTAEGEAKANQLRAASYSSNAKLLDLEIARATAEGLSNACRSATTCVIGGSVADLWKR